MRVGKFIFTKKNKIMNTTITSQTNEKELNAFRELNLAWLEKFFEVEAYDNEVLNNPNKYILEKKGQIFFRQENSDSSYQFIWLSSYWWGFQHQRHRDSTSTT